MTRLTDPVQRNARDRLREPVAQVIVDESHRLVKVVKQVKVALRLRMTDAVAD